MKKIMTRLLSLVLLGTFIPSFVLADNWYLENGDITVTATEASQTVSQGSTTKPDSAPIISNSSTGGNSASTDKTVTIKAEGNATANVTLENVNIDTDSRQEAAITTQGSGNVNLNLSGDNTVKSGDYYAGVHKENTGNLTITTPEGGSGSLNATGGKGGAGIGGAVAGGKGDNITISGGTITATGGEHSAGIGGGGSTGSEKDGSNITISGGDVTANGAGRAAGIGGGNSGNGTDIHISGGKVTATGGEQAAGIGGGDHGNGSSITVSGGEVIATGKGNIDGGGAGIGGGDQGNGTDIAITGGQLTAQGNLGGAGIGGGRFGTGSNVTVSGEAQVRVQVGKTDSTFQPGAGIGSGGTGVVGTEITPDTSKLKEGGFIHYYAPGADMETENPIKTIVGTLSGHSRNDGEVPTQQSPYWVSGPDGQGLTYQAQCQDGVLTVTVQADTASLRGTTGSLRQLEAQGITKILFVTNQAQSAFALSDLLSSGTGSFALTHEGEKATFTLADADISGIIQ